jgi:hypothetical protein
MKKIYNYFFKKKEGETISIGQMIIFGVFLFAGFYLIK